MTYSEPRAQAQVVKHAVSSVVTSSSSNVAILNELLNSKAESLQKDDQAPSKTNPTKPVSTITRTKPTSALKSRGKPKVKVREVHVHDQTPLTPAEKYKLATDVVNTTLKALTDAIKSPPQLRRQSSSKDVNQLPRTASTRSGLSRSASTPQPPLQPRSLNRVSSSPAKPTVLRRTSSSASIGPSPGLYVIAECARLGFAYLRLVQSGKARPVGLPPLQLENGMSALVGRLITLGLEELAVRELRILKNRLISYNNRGMERLGNDKRKGVGKQAPKSEKETLVSFLHFEDTIVTEEALEIAVAIQMHTLKLIVSTKRAATIEAASEDLYLSSPSSPANLIMKLSANSSSASKVARQLEVFSKLVLSLCPSILNSEDQSATNRKLSVSPETAFALQTLAFEVRLLWWKLAGHQFNPEEEIFDPLARCFSAYARRSTQDVRERYQTGVSAFHNLRTKTEDASLCTLEATHTKQPASSAIQNIYKLLGSLSQDAGLVDEAISWTNKRMNLLRASSITDARYSATMCKIAAQMLRKLSSGQEVEDVSRVLPQALFSLKENAKGDSAGVDELLTETVGLRRAAIEYLSKIASVSVGERTSVSSSLRLTSASLVLASVHYLTRYLGTPPRPSAEVKAITRYDQRKMVVASMAKAAIDSIVSLTKLVIAWDDVEWSALDASLQDACVLAAILDCKAEHGKQAIADAQADKYLPFVKISNMYWAYYLHLKQTSYGRQDLDVLKCVRRSVDTIMHRSRLEKGAGFLTIKLERLGGIYHSYNRSDEAKRTLAQCISCYFEAGILRIAATAAATKSVREIWEGDGELGLCGRALSTWIRFMFEADSCEDLLDALLHDTIQEADGRGILLEWQLITIAGLLTTASHPVMYGAAILSLADILLRLYDNVDFPIRRMRVVNYIIHLQSNHGTFFHPQMIKELVDEGHQKQSDQSENDRGLQRFSAHFQATKSVSSAFIEGHPPVETLERALGAWLNLLNEADSWASVVDQVDDVTLWISQLNSILDFLAMKGLEKLRVPVLILLTRIHDSQDSVNYNDLTRSFSCLGLQYLRLGYSGKAGLSLSKARSYLPNVQVSNSLKIECHLAYAEYFLEIGDREKCGELLATAGLLMKGDPDLSRQSGSSATLSGRIRTNRLLAEASYVCALLDFERGQPNEALAHAKRSVSLNQRAWAIIEHVVGKQSRYVKEKTASTDLEDLADGTSALSTISGIAPPVLPHSMSTTHESLKGPRFWSLVPSLYRGLCQLSRLYSHQGMFQEVNHYNEQVRKIATSVNATTLISRSLAISGDFWVRGGHIAKGETLLREAMDSWMGLEESKDTAHLHCSLGYLHHIQSNWLDGFKAFEKADAILDGLTAKAYISGLDWLPTLGDRIEEHMSQLTLKERSAPYKAGSFKSIKNPVSKSRKIASSKAKAAVKSTSQMAEECPQLLRLRREVLRQKALAMILQQKVDMAASLLLEAETMPDNTQGLVQQRLTMAKQLLTRAVEGLAADAVFCVLPDSTISFPSVALASKSRLSERSPGKTMRLSPPCKSPARVPNHRKGVRPRAPVKDEPTENLLEARDTLLEVQSMVIQMCSISTVNKISNILSSTVMLLSAAGLSSNKVAVQPTSVAFSMEIPRILALYREKRSIQFEKLPKAGESVPSWPVCVNVEDNNGKLQASSLECSRFQKDYIDILPPTWTVISISIGESRDEIFISKLQAGHNPFILRLPLSRHNSRDADEEVFGLDQGKTELLELIELANFSTHQARDMTSKGAKAEWWAEREALDDRLKSLLVNMENMWLGGFKGIFSQHTRRPTLLSRFQRSFQLILERHLPSRQNAKGRLKPIRVNLDPQILELFVGLGDATIEGLDLEEPLTDLLYFVVDVLQFHGERNAYDEIDFDSIVLETQDALRHYHESAKAASSDDSKQHTIMILDKSLHVFPWESLPILKGLSVSRLPSLSCLRDRLIMQKQQAYAGGLDGYHIHRGNGTYVLNPAGDLKSTQETFETCLNSLDNWQAIVRRDPSEQEFKDALETRDLLLYFGHGSGAQFIRARTIKKLDQCAVALLMGCSSGTLTEAGEFEPYGTPINYMHAGCPALVATLWDVTDKDIDRFSRAVLERWGLLPPPTTTASADQSKSGPKTKNRKNKDEVLPSAGGSSSLVEAVAKARDSCILGYLNGAAPVVYGIPVYLS
ncbi:MAG: hypothetical protein M1835_005290 [Candelina submexicana]|nr:MAG: hypothetical protein M1835_005290 [Candelina submexicana]